MNILSLRKNQAHEFSDCVPMNDIPVGIGDTYKDGVFYRDGERVKSRVEQLVDEALSILRGEVEEE